MMEKNVPAVIALGMFDGVHVGHRALLAQAVYRAKELGTKSIVYSFSNHPRSVFAQTPKLLMTAEERKTCMHALGIDIVRLETFDRHIAGLAPQEFIADIRAAYDVRGMVVGFDYSFGHGGKGTADTLRRLGAAYGFGVDVIPSVMHNGLSVSSTRIRELIERGGMEEANGMLCAPYSISGNVVGNRRIGTSIGFPTANLFPPDDKVLPLSGVYAAMVMLDGQQYPAVTNIGTNPTVQGKQVTVESHILNFEGDLYGKAIRVAFYAYLRGEQRFADKEELAAQIARDTEHAAFYLKTVNQ